MKLYFGNWHQEASVALGASNPELKLGVAGVGVCFFLSQANSICGCTSTVKERNNKLILPILKCSISK